MNKLIARSSLPAGQAGKLKVKARSAKQIVLLFSFTLWVLNFTPPSLAQDSTDLEINLDVNSQTVPLPKILRPNIDLSGRGFHRSLEWPQELAAPEAMDAWQKDIGFPGVYRMKYNLWEIGELVKNKNLQDKLLANYESVLKRITESGGVVIVDVFGTPAGLGKILDKKSPVVNLKSFKGVVKERIRVLSCEKKYNIWYEVWSAPDIGDFFLGKQSDYLNMYRMCAEAIKELEKEYGIQIPLGGPSSSWWFQSAEGNTVISPERSLIYDLIAFCYHYRLPLDFISWHAYVTDPKVEQEMTVYHKKGADLIRTWLTYFHFEKNIPLIIDEWNFDSGSNILAERGQKSNIAASYILSRIQKMYLSGIDNQVYYCLEDFQNNKENVVSNTGVFFYDDTASEYKGAGKSTYNTFRMLGRLGKNMFLAPKLDDEFVGLIATKTEGEVTLLVYNYIDPELAKNYLSRNIASLNSAQRKMLLGIIRSDKLDKILRQELVIASLRLTHKLKDYLKKAQELYSLRQKLIDSSRNLKLNIKNLKGKYLYQRYVIDNSCVMNCKFIPEEEKEINPGGIYHEALMLSPYSIQMIVLKSKPEEKVTENIAISAAQPELGMSSQAQSK